MDDSHCDQIYLLFVGTFWNSCDTYNCDPQRSLREWGSHAWLEGYVWKTYSLYKW
jgi:hypothetical protein